MWMRTRGLEGYLEAGGGDGLTGVPELVAGRRNLRTHPQSVVHLWCRGHSGTATRRNNTG